MNVTIKRLIDPEEMVPAMRVTRGKAMLAVPKKPSLELWHKMIISQHSSHRVVVYRVFCEDVPYFAHVHFVRHNLGVQFHVKSQRSEKDRDNIPQGALIDMFFDANVQALIHIEQARLCYKADAAAQALMQKIKYALILEGDEYDRVLGNLLMKPCQWYPGYCSEPSPCGRVTNITKLVDLHQQALKKEK